MKKVLFLLQWLLSLQLLGQNGYFSDDYHNFWARWMGIRRTPKVDYIAELIFRQQENEFAPPYWAGHDNPFAAPQLRGIRLWAQYKLNPHWRMDLASSWFQTFPTIRKPIDIDRPFWHDARVTFLPVYIYRKNRFECNFRTGGEIMWVMPQHFDSTTLRTRLRERPLVRYRLAKGLFTSLADEFFISVLHNGKLRYDQHRPSWMFHYEPKLGTLIESGVMWNYRPADPVHTVIWMFYLSQVF